MNRKKKVTLDDYGEYETAWCPGCGNFAILKAVKQALVASKLSPHEVLFVSGIGQAAKAPHYLNANLFDGLHGRAIPVATGAKLANANLTVIVESGDGCTYGEGGNHFLAAIRRNVNLTLLVHDNQIYGLTKGQASPTSMEGFVTKAQPCGVHSAPLNPIGIAVAMRAGFVARSFSGLTDHLADMIRSAISHQGFAIVDVLQPCVSFNKVNTHKWYKDKCVPLPRDYDSTDWESAMKVAFEQGDRIPIGVIHENNRPSFESHFPVCKAGPLSVQNVDLQRLEQVLTSYA